MTTTPPLPRTLPAWIKALDDAPLPAFAAVHGKVRLALRDASKSMRQIAELIQDSPVLALRFIQEANRGIGDGQPAESLEVALSRIGLQRAEALLARIPAMEAQDMPRPLRQVVLISRHASQQANGLFAARLARLWQDIHWGSLLFLAPAWALVGAYPHLLDAWEQRVLVRASRPAASSANCSAFPCWSCASRSPSTGLPDWIIQGYRLLRRPAQADQGAAHCPRQRAPAAPAADARRRSGIAALADAAEQHHRTGQRPGAVGAPQLERHPQPALATPGRAVSAGTAGELQQMVHQQAVISARDFGATDLWHPAQGLLWPSGSRFQVLREVSAATSAPTADLTEWREHCRRLLAEPSPFSNVLQLTATASQALTSAGMQRSLVLLVDRKQNRLVAQQCVGLPGDAARLTLAPEQSQVVRRLLEKPAQLRLQPANMAQFSALLPGGLKALFAGEHLLLRSLGVDGRVLMLVVADQNGAPLSDASVQTFAKTSQCIERALSLFGRRGG